MVMDTRPERITFKKNKKSSWFKVLLGSSLKVGKDLATLPCILSKNIYIDFDADRHWFPSTELYQF